MILTTAEDAYASLLVLQAGVPVAAWAACTTDITTQIPTSTDKHVTAQVEVNGGRWIVRCPFCPSAQVASASDQRFLCAAGQHGCGNAQVGGKFIAVVWPDDNTVAQIEKALEPRSHVNRNYLPGESVADLIEQNEQNGII